MDEYRREIEKLKVDYRKEIEKLKSGPKYKIGEIEREERIVIPPIEEKKDERKKEILIVGGITIAVISFLLLGLFYKPIFMLVAVVAAIGIFIIVVKELDFSELEKSFMFDPSYSAVEGNAFYTEDDGRYDD